jgi:uncharacterized membrane protein
MTMMLLGLLLFLGSHGFVRMRGPRDALEARLGAGPYKGLFSLVSLAGFVLLIMGYGQYRASGAVPVWTPPAAMAHAAAVLMLPAMILLAAAYSPGAIKAAVVHPMLASVKVWAIAHLLANGDFGSMLLFGLFLLWAVLARIRLGRAGRVQMAWGRGDWVALAAGSAAWAALAFGFHQVLIGVPVFG